MTVVVSNSFNRVIKNDRCISMLPWVQKTLCRGQSEPMDDSHADIGVMVDGLKSIDPTVRPLNSQSECSLIR